MRPLHVGHRIALTLILALLAVAPSLAKDGTMSGVGSETDPYIIHDAKDWETFAKEVDNGNTYVNQFIKLELDISVTQQVGSYTEIKVGNSTMSIDKPFSGTFDGDGRTIHADITESDGMGTALFGYIKGAIIKNLSVTGEIHGGIHAAGLVGISKGSGNRIENCVVAATVNGGTHIGGILGHGSKSDIAIDNCVFNGILDGGSNAKGVFFGWGDNGGTKTVSNCLYIQQDGQGTDYLDLVQMNAGSVAVTDCYKTADVGTYGTLAYLNPPTDAITEEKTVAGDTKFYVVTKKLSLTGSGTESAPYIVNNADQWNEFAEFVRDGASFAGKFFKLNANISVSTKAGVVQNDGTLVAPFSGTFDGGGYTITALIEDVDNPGTALFSYIEGATIKNLKLAGSVSGGIHAAGLVGFSNGTGNKIEKCVVSATINGGTYIGGILGHGLTSDIFIDNCVFNGILDGGSNAKGVFFGWGDNGGTKTVSNCLYIQQDGQGTDYLDLVQMNAGSVAVTDCYKTVNVGTYGVFVYLSAPTDANMIIEEKTAADGTMFYVVTGFTTGEVPVTSATTEMMTGSYRVFNDVTVGERIKINGDVKLILDEGKTLNATKGIELSDDNKLTIDGKGTLNATGDENFAGIGAVEVGMLVIENGIVNATGGDYGAGIGGSKQNSIGGTITINGGIVSASGGDDGSGIGGGYNGSGGTITINGGIVSASGGDDGSGIGGGYNGSGGTITINGGIVSAEGGSYGAGIGGGYRGFAGTISVRGGMVTAIAGKNASGIGSGYGASASGSVTLGWTNEDDFIYASNYGNVSSINFVENKYFYFTDDDGKVFGATTENIDGKKILPVTNKSSILNLNVSGIQPYYLYTGNDITIAYDVFDLDGKKLTKGTDYTGSFDKNPINDKGVYTLTITANENSGYTGSNNIRFIVADCLPVTSFTTTLAERYGISVYEVSEDVVVGGRIVVSGNVRLVLDEGKTLTAKRGVEVSEGDALTIEGKGTLQAKGSSNKAGIGGGDGASGGNITINGGIITSTGSGGAAGIGGGDGASGGNITINGGTVTSTGGSNGAGIGGGYKGSGGIITIKGGTVTSTGGSNGAGIGGGYKGSGGTITIKGGAVTSTGGSDAAGIGGGVEGSGVNIIINGGTVTSTGGSNGAGIGGGEKGSAGTIIINDGTVTSTGKYGSGIGGGNEGFGGNITINGGIVTAKSVTRGSGLGGGYKGSGGTITIKGGTVTSTGGYNAAGIGGGDRGSGGTVILNGGKVTAFAGENASGIGPGYKGTGGTVMLGWTSEDDFIYADNYKNVESIGFIYDENENKEKQFYYVLGGKNKVASTDDIGGKTIYPYYGENSLKNAMVSGINSYYTYTGKEISIAYTIVDYNDKTLVKESDYTEKINPWPIKNKGEYTLTITAKEGCGYTDSKTIRFTVFTDDEATLVTNETEEMTSGVYRVSSDVTVSARIIVKGNVLLILDEGKTLTAPKGIEVSDGNALTIEGKGILDAHGNSGNAGIGGGQGFSSGIITINGGMVKSTGGKSGSGIGGGDNGYGGIITINGGTVISTGGNKGSGIGGGAKGASRNITINGGVVIAKGGESGSGIGGGINYSGGKITINGGKVISTGGSSGSGIGGGDKGYGGKITINAGTIVSTGGESGSGIGGGAEDHGGTILINGGSVTANGGESGSGIGGGANGSGGTVIVNGGKVSANSNSGGSGIGPGSGKSGGTVMLGWTNEDDFIYASNYKNVKSLSFAEGKQFYYIKNGVNTVATTDDIGGAALYPYFGENSLKNAVISGVEPFYIYSGDEIKLSYKVLDLEGKELVEGTDYESSFDKLPLKDMGEYTLTISAVESSDYVGSISVKFIIADAIPVTSSTVEMNDSYGLPYKVFDDVTVLDRIKINGDVTLVLGKEKTLDALSGIQVSENNKLTILGEGAINAIGSERCAGIGGGYNGSGGTVIINGGMITSNGGKYASGIGGGIDGEGGTVIITGGTVFSTGGKWGSGIGGGYNGSGGTVFITGGTVTSNGGVYASGIGSGSDSEGGTVSINGGKVTATGGSYASGIGGGTDGEGGTITINGGTVVATGGEAGSGIGSGSDGEGGTVSINGGTVVATGGEYGSGIGSGSDGEGGTVVINGGKVTANAGKYASGIGPGGSSDDEVDVVISGSVTLGWTNEDDFIYASNFNNVSSLTFAENKQFYYTENGVNKVALIDNIAGKELHPYFGEHNLENASISGVEQSYTYTGKAIIPTFKVYDFKGQEISKDNYVVSITKNGIVTSAVNTGEYTMVFMGKDDYEGSKEVKFSIVTKVSKYAAIQVFEDENGKRAEIDGEYNGTEAVKIDEDIKDVTVTFNREFTPNSGYATIMFPFDVNATKLTGVRSVIEFDGIKTDKNNNNTVGMRYVWCNATLGEEEEKKHPDRNCNKYSGELKAYTPYMIEMESATLGIKDAVTLVKWSEFDEDNKRVGDAPVGNWVFRGTLQKKVWPKGTGIINEGRLWAFAGSARNGASIGKFVQFGGNNWVNPFRAYLVECKDTGNGLDCSDEDSETQPSLVSRYRFADALAPTDTAATDEPLVMRRAAASETASLNSMDIVIVYGDKDSESDKERPTVIGRFNPATGEIRMLPRTKQTYDLKGRKVGNGKKAKGAYYNRR